MPYQDIGLELLRVNRANDRHGELENETAAIAELFRLRDQHMRNLANDIANEGKMYDPPLVAPDGEGYVVFDGNRRVACLKLILTPGRAPSQDLQRFFQNLNETWEGNIPATVTCQVETDRDIIDAILYRRHTGSQGGVGQSDWDDRAKRNFIDRTGRGGRVDVAVEIERILADEDRLPRSNIPRSTLNRLLSSEVNRNRVGVSVVGNRFRITHNRETVLDALARVALDLAERDVVLGDLWDNEGKRSYLNRLEAEGVLPHENDVLAEGAPELPVPRRGNPRRGGPLVRPRQTSFIPEDVPAVAWRADQGRTRAVWEELQSLSITTYPNAISALTRILLELAVEGYLNDCGLNQPDNLAQKVRASAADLLQRNIIDQAYFDELDRMRQHSELISIRSMQRYVHSATFAPLPNEIVAYWTRLGRLILACLNH